VKDEERVLIWLVGVLVVLVICWAGADWAAWK